MERIVGHRPVSCPWRAYYDPLVREVMALSWAVEEGNLAAATGDDPPAILLDAVGMYRQALSATLAEDRRLAEEERKAQKEAREAAKLRQQERFLLEETMAARAAVPVAGRFERVDGVLGRAARARAGDPRGDPRAPP
jgi:hypothetical protein